jgi:probable HAF family extracellular repeat protein
MNRILASLSIWIASAAILSGASLCMAQSYTLTDLGALFAASPVNAINNNGQIVGESFPPGSTTGGDPFLLSNGTIVDLGNFSGSGSYTWGATAVNSLGQAVGTTGGGPFFYNGTTLNLLSPSTLYPLGVNTAGTIVGWNAWGTAFVLQNGVLTEFENSLATAVNTPGQVAGASQPPGITNPNTLSWQATIWQPDLTPTLLGILGTGVQSQAEAINDAGQVAGFSYLNPDYSARHAFLYSNGTMTDIDTFNTNNSLAYGINNNGVVVGMVDDQFDTIDTYSAFVYVGGTMIDLNTLIPSGSGLILMQALGINDSGQIVGNGITSDGNQHGFLLTPIAPEITSISPKSGVPGTLVTIRGKHFSTNPKACWVTINGVAASKWTKWTDMEIQIVVPAKATTGKLEVTALLQKSNSESFAVK